MNRNLDGTRLTRDDLVKIAGDLVSAKDLSALTAGLHNDSLIMSKLNQITAERRLEMFMRGQLILDTRFDRKDT